MNFARKSISGRENNMFVRPRSRKSLASSNIWKKASVVVEEGVSPHTQWVGFMVLPAHSAGNGSISFLHFLFFETRLKKSVLRREKMAERRSATTLSLYKIQNPDTGK